MKVSRNAASVHPTHRTWSSPTGSTHRIAFRRATTRHPAAWDPGTDITKYAQAALVLDLIAAENNARVWRGAAITDVQRGKGRERVPDVVNKLLQDFPPKR